MTSDTSIFEATQRWQEFIQAIQAPNAAGVEKRLRDAWPQELAQSSCTLPVVIGSGTYHAFALATLLAQVRPDNQLNAAELRQKAQERADICRLFIAARAPAHSTPRSASTSNICENRTFVAEAFTTVRWSGEVDSIMADLFHEYVLHGYALLETPLYEYISVVGGRLPLDAAIKVGHAAGAGLCIDAGCDVKGIAVDGLGREMDLLEYVRTTADLHREETAAAVAGALMRRTLAQPAAAPAQQASPRKRRGSV